MQCRVLMVADSTIANMYSNQKDSITIDISVYMWHKTANVRALLDSGATHNFIDKRTVKQLGLGTHHLTQPQQVRNVNGTENQEGAITQYCDLWLQQGSETNNSRFFIANLGCDQIILGYPWFKTFNPTIDWTANTLVGESVIAETAGYQMKKQCIIRTLKPTIDPSIPTYYHRHAKVFNEEASHRFPPEREEDHIINLKEGALSPLKCKVYPQTVAEEEATQAFINVHLEKGYIEELNSPYASPFFFQKKKDGKL